MTEKEREILETLTQLSESVKQMKGPGPKTDLLSLFERLDRLTLSLPPNTDHSLLHYLHKKSYEKALVHLKERSGAVGETAR